MRLMHQLFLLLLLVGVQLYGHPTKAAEPCADATAVSGVTLYVSPAGNDKWSGRYASPTRGGRDGPVASLAGARDKIRLVKARAQPIRVIVQNGLYTLTAPVVFESRDSGTHDYPICYRAADGARPVFSGGRRITGWKADADGIWWADIPAVKDGSWYFEQLWVNGRRARRARAAGDAATFTIGVYEQQLPTGLYQQTIAVPPAELQSLAALTPAELADVSFVALHKWQTTRRFVQTVDPSSGLLTVQSRASMDPVNPMTGWMPYYVENFRAALDQPGEWFLSRAGRLYYKPRAGEDMPSAEVVAPVLPNFLLTRGNPSTGTFVQNLGFDGLAFAHSQWLTAPAGVDPWQSSPAPAAIDVQAGRNLLFKNCEILHTGTYAIAFWNGTRQAVLRRCRLEYLGAGGVRVGDTWAAGETVPYFTKQITLDNNIIRHGGRFFHDAYGVWIGRSSDNHVTHNEIADFYQVGIGVGWSWGYAYSPSVRNNISFNHVHHLGWRLTSDLGGIYTLGVSPGTTIHNNVVHDVYAFTYGGWGIYLDEGSSEISVRNNLSYNNLGGFHLHYGLNNLVSNNIFAYNQQNDWLKTRVAPGLSVRFANNIVQRTGGQVLQGFGAPDAVFEKNTYFDPSGGLLRFDSVSFYDWQGLGRDAGSIVADPGFVDAAGADYRFVGDSPALALGFMPFDTSLAGVYGDLAWMDRAASTYFPQVDMPPLLPSFRHLP